MPAQALEFDHRPDSTGAPIVTCGPFAGLSKYAAGRICPGANGAVASAALQPSSRICQPPPRARNVWIKPRAMSP